MHQGLPYYKRYPIAFLDGAQGLGPEVIGAYSVLLDLIYARGGMSPRDDRHLGGLLGCSTRKARSLTNKLIEAGKIEVTDDGLMNGRARHELSLKADLSSERAEAGRRGGRAGKGVSKSVRDKVLGGEKP